MSQGRGSALLVAVMVAMVVVVLHAGIADATSYTVGGRTGWSFNTDSWPAGKRFRAGDTLVFNYNSALHNVVPVSKAGYDSCTAPRSAKVFQTGKDQIRLARGRNYFICTFQGHCQSGMKVAVTAQ